MAEPMHLLTLPEIMDLSAAGPLAKALLALQGKPVSVDASAVQRLGGLCLQVLLSADRSWAERKVPFTVVKPSHAFRDCAELLGAQSLLV
jgi:chemotaxis protein CheX